MGWMHTMLHSLAWGTLRSIICALWPLQLLALFFACCELVWFALKLKRTFSASSLSLDASGSGISSGLDHASIAAARLIAGNEIARREITIDEVIQGNAHQRRIARRRIARGREIL